MLRNIYKLSVVFRFILSLWLLYILLSKKIPSPDNSRVIFYVNIVTACHCVVNSHSFLETWCRSDKYSITLIDKFFDFIFLYKAYM